MRIIDKYGLTPRQLEELWKMQQGKCAGCGRPLKKEAARLDYDPRTHKARGYVCYRCAILSRAADNSKELKRIVVKLHECPPAEDLYAAVLV